MVSALRSTCIVELSDGSVYVVEHVHPVVTITAEPNVDLRYDAVRFFYETPTKHLVTIEGRQSRMTYIENIEDYMRDRQPPPEPEALEQPRLELNR